MSDSGACIYGRVPFRARFFQTNWNSPFPIPHCGGERGEALRALPAPAKGTESLWNPRPLRRGFGFRVYGWPASFSMAWAKTLVLRMNFSQSMYSSGMWQVSTSPGKQMPNATVLGIMRE